MTSGCRPEGAHLVSDRDRHMARPLAVLAVVGVMLAAAIGAGARRAQDGMPPAEVRAVIEGTWELTEWHVGDVVVRPPEMEGLWMVHDGHVMAIRHRTGPARLPLDRRLWRVPLGPGHLDLWLRTPGGLARPDLRQRRTDPQRLNAHPDARTPDHPRGRHADPRERRTPLGIRHPGTDVPPSRLQRPSRSGATARSISAVEYCPMMLQCVMLCSDWSRSPDRCTAVAVRDGGGDQQWHADHGVGCAATGLRMHEIIAVARKLSK